MALRSERRFISPNNIESGMMIQFSYVKENGDSGLYEVIVIDPKKSVREKIYLHALLLEGMTDQEIFQLVARLGDTVNFNPDKRAEPLTNLQTDAAYERYKGSTLSSKRVYRTFLFDKISNARQILIGTPE